MEKREPLKPETSACTVFTEITFSDAPKPKVKSIFGTNSEDPFAKLKPRSGESKLTNALLQFKK